MHWLTYFILYYKSLVLMNFYMYLFLWSKRLESSFQNTWHRARCQQGWMEKNWLEIIELRKFSLREEAGGQLRSWQRPNSGFERRKIGFVGGQHPWCDETALRPGSAVLVTTTEAKRKRSSDLITRMGTQRQHLNTSRCICVAEGLTIIMCESVWSHFHHPAKESTEW